MTAQRYVHDIFKHMCCHSWQGSHDPFLNKGMLDTHSKTSLSGGRLILPERLGNGLSGTGGLPSWSQSLLAEDCDRSGTATSVDGTFIRKMNPIPCSDP
ncbi:hypothetical protein TNCV_3195941 [Trichonephila clavipes]|nr:hypothetical protein TNCV_3195941 [Trichonephila clavipes]